MNQITLTTMLQYIEASLTSPLSLSSIASKVYYSPYYCSKEFHRHFGTSIKQYIVNRRLDQASKDLLQQETRIIDIAIRYQYQSQEAFSRAFIQRYGIAPAAFRIIRPPLANYPSKLRRGTDRDANAIQVRDTAKKIHQILPPNASSLHIVSGECMLETFNKANFLQEDDICIPFNEAMCWGDTETSIFSTGFIETRITALQTTAEAYQRIVLTPLAPLFEMAFDRIILWFGDEMFCQINLLTILAYLEQVGYTGDIFYCVNQELTNTMLPDAIPLELTNCKQDYLTLLCDKQPLTQSVSPLMYQASKHYLRYRSKDSEILQFIQLHKQLPVNDLIRKLLQQFPHYGLGDYQYQMLIAQYYANHNL